MWDRDGTFALCLPPTGARASQIALDAGQQTAEEGGRSGYAPPPLAWFP